MNKSRKIAVRVICILLALLMAASLLFSVLPVRASAVSRAELNKLKEDQKALQEQSDKLQENIDKLETTQAGYLERKAAMDKRIEVNRQEINNILEQISVYEAAVEETRAKLAEATQQENDQYTSLRAHMRAMEESGTLSYVDILLHATSLTDFLSKYSDISEIMERDQNLQKEYVQVREDVQALKAELAEEQSGLQAVKAELELKQERLEAQTVAAYEMLAALENDLDTYNQFMEENEAAEKELLAEIDKMTKELQKQEAAAAAAAAAAGRPSGGSSGGSAAVSKGSFVWPTTSYLITSQYGWRIHPIQGTNKFHAGVDIGAGAGANIYAAAGGTVAVATSNSSYGNYVLINHGNGNSTLYAHMSSMAVSVGQVVTQGQVIGYVGSTGASTGPHLHFEVRVNGSTVDPLAYFSGYTIYDS